MGRQRNAYRGLVDNRYDAAITGARWWSRLYMHGVWGVDYNRTGRRLMDMLPADGSGMLLDVPVGTMVFTHEGYAQRKGLQVVGVDYSQEMLDIAEERRRLCGLDNVRLLRGDVGDLPFADCSFDYVLCMNGIQVFPDKPRAIGELVRVLRPGGYCYGSLYTRGVRRLADWVVKLFLNGAGLMSKPHYTRKEACEVLSASFGGALHAEYDGAVMLFCVQKGGGI